MTNFETVSTDVTFIHLTDLHLTESADHLVKGYSPTRKLEQVLARICSMEINPAFIVVTGDLVNNGTAAEYRYFQQVILRKFRTFGVPVLTGLGNHDDRLKFRKIVLDEQPAADSPYYYSVEVAGINVIMLDSHIPGQTEGLLDDAQLSWLDNELTKPMHHGHLIGLHHPPVPCTVDLLNALGLRNPDALATIVHCHRNILGVLSGHIHYSHIASFAKTISVTAPAVLYGIDPGVQRNLRTLNNSGFAIGTIRAGQLMMNPVMVSGAEAEIDYREVDLNTLSAE